MMFQKRNIVLTTFVVTFHLKDVQFSQQLRGHTCYDLFLLMRWVSLEYGVEAKSSPS